MRHATTEDLDRLEALLEKLRNVSGLRERKRGYFSRGSRAFLHFHAHGTTLYADVRLEHAFDRLPVTTEEEHARLLNLVHDALLSPDVHRPD